MVYSFSSNIVCVLNSTSLFGLLSFQQISKHLQRTELYTVNGKGKSRVSRDIVVKGWSDHFRETLIVCERRAKWNVNSFKSHPPYVKPHRVLLHRDTVHNPRQLTHTSFSSWTRAYLTIRTDVQGRSMCAGLGKGTPFG